MYGKTDPRIERKIMTVFWLIACMCGMLLVCRLRSVHVTSVTRRKEDDGAAVFLIEVTNPTEQSVSATIMLTVSSSATGNGEPLASIAHEQPVLIPGGETIVVTAQLEAIQAALYGGTHFGTVYDVQSCDVLVK